MRQTSALYKTLRTTIDTYYDVEVILYTNPVKTYGIDKLKTIKLHPALFDQKGPKIGGTFSTQCDLEVNESSANWPRMAEFEVRLRLSTETGSQTSEWLSMGRYYTDERTEDGYYTEDPDQEEYHNLRVTAYDGMLRTEQYWTEAVPESLQPSEFPVTSRAWCRMLQNANLAKFDNLDSLDDSVKFVGFNTGETIRDVLKTIASGNGGNWHMVTEVVSQDPWQTEDVLKLIPFANIVDGNAAVAGIAIAGITVIGSNDPGGINVPAFDGNTQANIAYLGMDVQSVESSPPLAEIRRVHLATADGVAVDAIGTGWSDSYYTLNGECEFVSSDGVANLCLSRMFKSSPVPTGYIYKPFSATNATLDPAAEVGDLVVINSKSYQIMSIDWNINTWPTANISAPCEEEVDHEYTIPTATAKNYRKVMSATDAKLQNYPTINEMNSAIEQKAGEISLSVTQDYIDEKNYDDLIASLQEQIDGAVNTFSGSDIPTLNNYPANEWTTDSLKSQHVGSLYLVTSPNEQAGTYYRFEQTGNQYGWSIVTDTALAQALADAASAQAAADKAIADANVAKQAASKAQGTAEQARLEAEAKAAQAEALAVLQAAADATNKANAALAEAKAYADQQFQNFINGEYQQALEQIKNQLDQKAETFYQATDPSAEWSNAIAGIAVAGKTVVGSIWADHEGDLWYRTSNDAYKNTTWYWNGSEWIQQDVPTAVFDQIDGKAQIFITEDNVLPTPPYNVGDIWANATYGQLYTNDLLRCKTQKTENGTQAIGDWQRADRYTDDAKAIEVDGKLTELSEHVESEFTLTAAAISAKVSSTGGSGSASITNSFGWVLDTDSHTWYANGSPVMSISASGLTVKGSGEFSGELKAATGKFTGELEGVIGTFSGTVSAGAIESSTITGGTISGGTITGETISSSNITGGTITGGAISGGTITGGAISSGSISGAVISGGSIAIGGSNDNPAFEVNGNGGLTATNVNITGGAITIMDANGRNTIFAVNNSGVHIGTGAISIYDNATPTPNLLFSANSSGVYVNGNGIFTGTVYAKEVVSELDQVGAGYINGGAVGSGINGSNITGGTVAGSLVGSGIEGSYIVPDSIDGGVGGAITSGSIGGISGGALSGGVLSSLGFANGYGLAIDSTSGSYPGYFCASQIVATSSFASGHYYVGLGGSDYDLAGHVHSFIINETTGDVSLGPPTNSATPATFNIADTDFYRDRVSAITISSLTGTGYTSDDGIVSGYISNADNVRYMNGGLYGCFTATYGEKTQTIRVGMNASAAAGEGEAIYKPTSFSASAVADSHVLSGGISYTDYTVKAYNVNGAQTGDDTRTTINTQLAYNAGNTAGITQGETNKAITSIDVVKTGQYQHRQISPNHIITITATANIADGTTRESNATVIDVGDAYSAGYTAAKDISNITVTKVTPDSQVVVNADNSVTQTYGFRAVFSDLSTSSLIEKDITVPASKVWNSVTIPSSGITVTRPNNYGYNDSDGYYIDVTAEATASNNATNNKTQRISANDVYNAGIAGGRSRYVAELFPDSVSCTEAYQSRAHTTTVTINAKNASGGLLNTFYYTTGTTAYDTGYSNGANDQRNTDVATLFPDHVDCTEAYQPRAHTTTVTINAKNASGGLLNTFYYTTGTMAYDKGYEAGYAAAPSGGITRIYITMITGDQVGVRAYHPDGGYGFMWLSTGATWDGYN